MSLRLKRLRVSQNTLLMGLALFVGLSTAGCVILFRDAFHFIEQFAQSIGQDGFIGTTLASLGLDPKWSVFIILPTGGLLVGLIMQTFVGHQKYHGVAGIMEAVALTGGRLRYKVTPFKAVASALSLGVGASVGPEDPSVQIGASLGSFISDKLHLSEEHSKLLVASGAASAIAAAFNAPIAGVFFALEVILGEFTTRSFGVVVLASVISSATTRYVKTGSPIFGELEYVLGNPIQLPFYILLGLILAFFSSVAVRYFHWQSDIIHQRVHLPAPILTMLVGFLVAFVSLWFPQIMGPGEAFMHAVLVGHADLAIWFLILLALVKLVMTAISQGGGFVGGVFAPTLFMGITFGSAYGSVLNLILPSSAVGNPQAYAIAGMAGLLAGIVRAPITAILLVFELTNDYLLILPIMLTSVVCVLLVERIGPAGIYELALIKQGLHLRHGRDVDVMQGILVQEAMIQPAPMIGEGATLRQLRDAFHTMHTRAICVVTAGNRLAGVVTLGDLQDAFETYIHTNESHPDLPEPCVGDICSRTVVTVAPHDALWKAVRDMGARDIGRLPVVDRDGVVIGMLRRHDIMNAYNTAIARKLQDQHYAEQIRLNTLTGAHVAEFEVRNGAMLVDTQIRDVKWPPEAVVASILRSGKLIVPHGDTYLRLHDRVTIVADPQAEPILEALFRPRV